MTTRTTRFRQGNIDPQRWDHLKAILGEALDKRQARIVELRFFGGLTVEETAELLEISPATVKRDWTLAKIWLRRELSAN